jgi:hypothetical protein
MLTLIRLCEKLGVTSIEGATVKRLFVLIGAAALAQTVSSAFQSIAQPTLNKGSNAIVQDKPGSWRRAETEHFIFYSDGSEKSLREDAVKLERFDRLMRQLTSINAETYPVKLTVYFVRSAEKVRALYPGPVKQIAGFYSPSPAGVLAVVPRTIESYGQGGDKFAQTEDVILFHEYAHHLMLQYFPVAYPAWYVEGFAEFIGNTRVERDGIVKYGIANISRAPSLFQGLQLPIEKLLTARVTDLKRDDVGNLYARGWLLTHYLNFEPSRQGQLQAYLVAVGNGKPSLDAAKESFGDLKLLNRAIDRYATGRLSYRELANPIAEPKPFAVTQLSEGTSDSLLLRVKLTRQTAPKEREPIAQELRKLAALHPRNADIATALAEAELDLENEAVAGQTADAALKIDPQSSRALLWKGLSLARPLIRAKIQDLAKWKEARSWIVKANRASPEDPLPLFEYYLSFIGAGLPPSETAVLGLGKAVALVPQDNSLRFTYASALANQKKYDLAVAVLQPVASNPHGGGASDAAQGMIARLMEAKREGKIPSFDLDAAEAEDK